MRKLLLQILIMGTAALLLFSCAGGKNTPPLETLTKTDGWIDENTYRINAEGKPLPTLQTRNERRESAKRAARMNAQFKIIKNFKGFAATYPAGSGSDMITPQNLATIIRNGIILDEMYDEADNCEILYEISDKNLQVRIQGADIDSLEIVN